MTGLLVDGAELVALRYMTGNVASTERLVLKLYKNDRTPSESDTAGDYTEATFTGYVQEVLTTWTFTAGSSPFAEHAEVEFVSTIAQPAQSVYGYYIVRETTGDLVAAERFPLAPITVQNVGEAFKVTPKITAGGA